MYLLIALLSLMGLIISADLFLFVFGVLLSSTALSYLTKFFVPPSMWVYLGLFLFHWLLALAFFGRRRTFRSLREECLPIVLFLGIFAFAHSLCLHWPDFFPMGERLRDYALLSSIIRSPYDAFEPWMYGFEINYYLFWYRFGHLLSTTLSMSVAETYHSLLSFAIAFFGAGCFAIFRYVFSFRLISAVVGTLLVIFGSNIRGLINALSQDTNWWGPSRVIKGAINEFPAWSFVLGDTHPHFLNLGLAPFAVYLLYRITSGQQSLIEKYTAFSCIALISGLWVYNANAWEVPLWGALFGLAGVVFLFIHKNKICGCWPIIRQSLFSDSKGRDRSFVIVGLIGLLGISLFLSSRNIQPTPQPLTFVTPPILKTSVSELFLHWGFPVTLIACSLVFSLPTLLLGVLAAVFLTASLFFYEAEVFLILLTGMAILRIFLERRPLPLAFMIREVLGIGALLFLLLPEVVFLNDSYGGENERMNTIFKIYSFSWFPLHLYAFTLIAELRSKYSQLFMNPIPQYIPKIVFGTLQLGIGVLFLSFFSQMIHLRTLSSPPIRDAAGLTSIEERFLGAKDTIQFLRTLPYQVLLEAQGNPYDWTSSICTLSDNACYLGWANHMNLLIFRAQANVAQRERTTSEIYTGSNCAEKRDRMQQEGITAIVVGPLEKLKYPGMTAESFGCFSTIFERGGFKVVR